MKRKICVVTSTRADYGHLFPLLRKLDADPGFELQLVATGTHLSPKFGSTYKAIEADGFRIAAKPAILTGGDTAGALTRNLGRGLFAFAGILPKLAPDLLVVIGDRYEMLAPAQAGLLARVPTAHISGGDLTEGAYDDSVRHSLSKLSHLHFATNAESKKRLHQLGEEPGRVFNVGSLCLDSIRLTPATPRGKLEEELGFKFRKRNIVVTYHPETASGRDSSGDMAALLSALSKVGPDVGIVITKPGLDVGSYGVMKAIDAFCSGRPNARAFSSLGQRRYYGVLRVADAVVGNSSSGIMEAPSFGIPTVNVGDRQMGRVRARSVIDCPAETGRILAAIRKALTLDCSGVASPYGDGKSAAKIMAVLKGIADFRPLLVKRFVSL